MATTRSASEAARVAMRYTSYPVGQCLNFVWKCISAPKSYGCYDADEAWSRAKQKMTTGTPPVGAPVYFRGGSHGHIAISLGGGKIRSTDFPTHGRVSTTTINDLCREWYGTTANYRGWSRDLCGDPIPGLQAPVVVSSSTSGLPVNKTSPIRESNLRLGKTNADVGRFQKALWNSRSLAERQAILRLTSRSSIGAGYYGGVTGKMTSDAYAHFGMTRNTQPGPQLLKRLGFTSVV